MAAVPADAAGFFCMTELVCIVTAAVLLLTGKGGGATTRFMYPHADANVAGSRRSVAWHI